MNRGNSRLAQAFTSMVVTTIDCQIQDKQQQTRFLENQRDFEDLRATINRAGSALRCNDANAAATLLSDCLATMTSLAERNAVSLAAEATDERLHRDIQGMLEALREQLLREGESNGHE